MTTPVSESTSSSTVADSSITSNASNLSILNNVISNTTATTSTSPLQLTPDQWTAFRSKPKPNTSSKHSTSASKINRANLSNGTTETIPPTTTSPSKQPFSIRPATPADAKQIAHLGATTFASCFGFSIPSRDLQTYLDDAYNVATIERELSEDDKIYFVAVIPSSPSNASEGGQGEREGEREGEKGTIAKTVSTSQQPSTTSDTDTDTDTDTSIPEPEEIVAFAMLNLHPTTNPFASPTLPPTLPFSTPPQQPSNPASKSKLNPKSIELQRIYVSPAHHSKSIGSTLLSHTLTHATRLGFKRIHLGVWEGNFIAQRVYEKLGFVRTGEHEFVMGRCVQIDWVMVKEL